ncbi:SRPBCC family protein [Streptomyces subrutilus]|uniref:aromatase/cyclase n=1 Tax=Streptomyces subrutilus TaxID=36818 RepID=UPI003422566A
MPSQRVHTSEQTASVAAPADVVYGLLADAVRWPLLLPGPVHVERIDFDGVRERLRLWDLQDGRVRSFHLHRTLDPHTRTVRFEQEDTARPGAPTTGTWTVQAHGPAHCRLTLDLDRTLDGPPDAATAHSRDHWQAEPAALLAHVAQLAERWEQLDELLLSFQDTLQVTGPAELVYDFLYRVEHWPDRVPHIDAAHVTEDTPGIQLASLDTCATPDGRTQATRSVRLCFPSAARIVYKELATPHPIAAHSGEWSLEPHRDGVLAVCAQQVMLRPDATAPPAPDTDPDAAHRHPDGGAADVRAQIRTWLGRAATDTLRLAAWHAQNTVRRLR